MTFSLSGQETGVGSAVSVVAKEGLTSSHDPAFGVQTSKKSSTRSSGSGEHSAGQKLPEGRRQRARPRDSARGKTLLREPAAKHYCAAHSPRPTPARPPVSAATATAAGP